MSDVAPTDVVATKVVSDGAKSAWFHRLEEFSVWVSEWLNPILVKESRQSLKSRQFVVTFFLLLICGWIWSLIGVAVLSPGVYYAPGGKFMLSGYLCILAFPLAIIVPFAAFRSLASEQEDGTYELLSISTLKPRQIIGGKLGSASLQILIYFSALSPCIVFTYLLRGIDILFVFFSLFYISLGSLFLSAFGLLLATITRARQWQIVLSVAFILGLAAVFFWTAFATVMMIYDASMPYDQPVFWVVQGIILSVWAGAFSLVFLAATARITFLSENRSTGLRLAMLVCHLAFIAWCVWCWLVYEEQETIIVYVMVASIFWWVMGAMMVGERSDLSPRARRKLPRSFLGRVFLTWFQPSSGTGYFFTIANVFVVVGVTSAMAQTETVRSGWRYSNVCVVMSFVFAAYVIGYLGLGRLTVNWLSRFVSKGPEVGLLVGLVLLAVGVLFPLILQLLVMRDDNYSALQIFNPFWTFNELIDGDLGVASFALGGNDWYVVPAVLLQFAILMLFVNLVTSLDEILPPRTAVPTRVVQEQRELHPEKFVEPKVTPQNPWDMPD